MKPIFPTWTKITLGNQYKTLEDFDRATKNWSYRDINIDCTEPMFSSPQYTPETEKRKVSIAIVTPRDLNFKGEWVEYEDLKIFFERALDCGLKLCPPETGPQIFIQAQSLPSWLTIAMNPIKIKYWRENRDTVFEIKNRPPQRESYHGWSRDEKPLDEGPIIHPGGPLLTISKYHEVFEKGMNNGTMTIHPFAFIKET